MDLPEQDLVNRATAGEESALTTLLERFGPAIRRDIATRIPRRWRSVLSEDDVMQQAYVDAFHGINRFVSQGDGAFSGWLRTLAKRNMLDAIRALETQKRGGDRIQLQQAPREESYVALFELVGGTSRTPSRSVAGREAQSVLEQAIQKLPDAYRTVIQMYDLDGRDVEAVAMELGRTPGAVYMVRTRAHRMLAETMGTPSMFLSGPS